MKKNVKTVINHQIFFIETIKLGEPRPHIGS